MNINNKKPPTNPALNTQRITPNLDRWIESLLISIAFCIPFSKKITPPLILLMGILGLIRMVYSRQINYSRQDIPLYLLALLFGLHLGGITYSSHLPEAVKELEIKLSFIGFPILGLLIPSIRKPIFESIKLAFIYGTLGYLLISLGTGIYDAINQHSTTYLSYELLSHPFHPTYAATYQALSVFLLLQQLNQGVFLFRKKWIHLSLLILIVLFISMLASKAGLIALWIAIAMSGLQWVMNRTIAPIKFTLLITLLAWSGLSMFLLPGISQRIEGAVNDVTTISTTTEDPMLKEVPVAQSSTALRRVTWNGAWQLLRTHPMGVGTGDTTPELVKIYESQGESHAASKALNAHNQFLQTGAELGWIALITLILLLLLMWRESWAQRDFLFLTFLLLLVMNFMFESFLEVQAGIIFTSFWILVFCKRPNSKMKTF